MAVPTDQELLDEYRTAMLGLATSQSYTVNGRTVTRQQLPEIIKAIEWLETRLGIDSGSTLTGGGFAFARFSNPS